MVNTDDIDVRPNLWTITYMLSVLDRILENYVYVGDHCNRRHSQCRPWQKMLFETDQINRIMLTDINPKLPMRNKKVTRDFYINKLDFQEFGSADFDGYLMLQKDRIQLHFFEFKELDPENNYGQVYIRTDDIDNFYQSLLDKETSIHPFGHLQLKPWGQKEFSLLDPDKNLLTFGQSIG